VTSCQTNGVIFGISYAQAVDKGASDYKESGRLPRTSNFGVFFGLFAARSSGH
jgi:hypothetical protein